MDLYGLRADTNENLLVTKAVQNSHSYVQTYITGISFPREVREYELCRQLEREARRCYEHRCRSNIYTPRRWELEAFSIVLQTIHRFHNRFSQCFYIEDTITIKTLF